MSWNTPTSSVEHSWEAIALDNLIKMQVMLETLLSEHLKPVLESPDAYLPNSDGTKRIWQKTIDLQAIYSVWGVPTSFTDRKTPEMLRKVKVINDTLRTLLRREWYDAKYWYGHIEDNDNFSLIIAEREFTLPESQYVRLVWGAERSRNKPWISRLKTWISKLVDATIKKRKAA